MKNGRIRDGMTSSWHTQSHSYMVVNALKCRSFRRSYGDLEELFGHELD